MDAASRPAVVIDNGTGYTKMGFAGNVEPCFITPTVVAVNDSFSTAQTPAARGAAKGNWLAQHSAGVMADLDFYIGEEALSRSRASSTYSLIYPIRNGQVENWDTMERFWQQCIFNYLRCDPEDNYFPERTKNSPELLLILSYLLPWNKACHTKAEYEEYGASICRSNPVFKGMY